MPQTVPAPLPEPPEFPASNASYNKIVGKMHKAALAAATSSAAVAAVQLCISAVTGTNTYAKASRRYGSKLLDALAENHPEPTPLAKAKASQRAKAAADKPVIDLPFVGRSFSNKSNAKRALAKVQLDHLPVEWQPDGDKVRPILLVGDAKGLAYAQEREFAAKVSA